MNNISKLRSKQKALIIAGSLLFGLALTPSASIAANAEHHGNRHAEKSIKHQNKGHHDKRRHADRRYYVIEEHHRHNHRPNYKHRRHYHEEPRYVVINNDHHHYSEPAGLQIGVHTGDFDIVFRD
ncbi:MAG TPA: hypothetical protein VIS54_03765 [Psychromonas sp.]